MNTKRIMIGLIAGILTGVVCVLGNLPNISPTGPNAGFLIVAFWQRVIMGAMVGMSGELQILPKKSRILNAIIRGSLLGIVFSWHLAFFTGVFSINFFIAGLAFGAIDDLLCTYLTRVQS